jgi:hypothetical protein
MALYRLTVQTDLDISLSPGDQLLYISAEDITDTFGVEHVGATGVKVLGDITRIGPIGQQGFIVDGEFQITENGLNQGEIEFESTASADAIEQITDSDFIFFRKNQVVNKSGLKGYYMQTTFKNNDYSNPVELFGIGSEVGGSSK